MSLYFRFRCHDTFWKGHFHNSGLHKQPRLPQICCAEIHEQPLNIITFNNAVFSVCLHACFEGHYHNKELTLHLIANFHIKVKIKRDSCVSLKNWYFCFTLFFKIKVIPALEHFINTDPGWGKGDLRSLCVKYINTIFTHITNST